MVSSSGLGQLLKEVTPDQTSHTCLKLLPMPSPIGCPPPTLSPYPPTPQHREFSLNEVYPVV